MQYKKLGNTPYNVSTIGIGCRGLVGHDLESMKHTIDEMEELGVNYIDLFSANPEFGHFMGLALINKREKFIIQAHLGAIWKDGQYTYSNVLKDVERGFSEQLKTLATGHVEIGIIHHIDSPKDLDQVLNGDIYKFAKKLKDMGAIRALGLSITDGETALLAAKSKAVETLMVTANVFDDRACRSNEGGDETVLKGDICPVKEELYRYCNDNGIGLSLTGVSKGGVLLDPERTPLKSPLSIHQCLSYALNIPAVSSAVCSSLDVEGLREACAYVELSSDAQEELYKSLEDLELK